MTHSEPKEKIEELVAAAFRIPSAGEYAAAEILYPQIWGLATDHQGALHDLGVVCTAEGRFPQENVAGIRKHVVAAQQSSVSPFFCLLRAVARSDG